MPGSREGGVRRPSLDGTGLSKHLFQVHFLKAVENPRSSSANQTLAGSPDKAVSRRRKRDSPMSVSEPEGGGRGPPAGSREQLFPGAHRVASPRVASPRQQSQKLHPRKLQDPKTSPRRALPPHALRTGRPQGRVLGREPPPAGSPLGADLPCPPPPGEHAGDGPPGRRAAPSGALSRPRPRQRFHPHTRGVPPARRGDRDPCLSGRSGRGTNERAVG